MNSSGLSHPRSNLGSNARSRYSWAGGAFRIAISLFAAGLLAVAVLLSRTAESAENYPSIIESPEAPEYQGSVEQASGTQGRVQVPVQVRAQGLSTEARRPKRRDGYERVPEEHVDSIANRLLLVERILRRHGRAYDYRTLTNRELLAIWQNLEQK